MFYRGFVNELWCSVKGVVKDIPGPSEGKPLKSWRFFCGINPSMGFSRF